MTVGVVTADIVSSDIVGYAQSGLQNGGTLVTPQFIQVGTNSAIPLQSIRPTGDDSSDNVSVQTLDAYGRTATSYMWINWAGVDSDQEAWVDDEYAIVEGIAIAPGDGLFVLGSSSNQGIQTAGKVGIDDVVVTLRNGATCTGNPFPVELDLQDIVAEGTDTSDNVSVQTLDAYGRTASSYMWINWAGIDGNQEAWVDDEYTIVENVKVAPGAGLFVLGSSSEQSIRFPAPDL